MSTEELKQSIIKKCFILIILQLIFFSSTSLNAEIVSHSWSNNDNSEYFDDNDYYKESQKQKGPYAGPKINKYIGKKRSSRKYYRTRKKSRTYITKRKNRTKRITRKRIVRKNRKKKLYYKIKRGDTLYKISKKFKVNINSLTKKNNISKRTKIYTGMILIIPQKKYNTKKRKKILTAKRKKRKTLKRKIIGKKNRPQFHWPVRKIVNCRRDGINGVKSIGILITGKKGSSVYTSAPGIVKKIGKMRGFGTYIVVLHKNRFMTVYSNLGSIKVSEGDNLRKKQIIGRIKKTLHFQIDYSGKPINPFKYLPRRS